MLWASVARAEGAACPGHVALHDSQATFYSSISPDACGLPVAPGAFVTAVASADFAGSAVCGRCLRVFGPLGSVVVQVTDECPGCAAGDLDLGADAFAQIGNPADGVIAISSESTECDVAGPIAFFFDAGSTPYYLALQVRNTRYAVASVELDTGSGWVALPRDPYNRFAQSFATPLSSPLDLRVSDVQGESLDELGVAYTIGGQVDGTGQFAVCPEPSADACAAVALAALLAGLRTRAQGRR